MSNNDHIAEDRLDYFYPGGMTPKDKFFEFFLPWIILAGICLGIFLAGSFILQGIIELSGPLQKGLGL